MSESIRNRIRKLNKHIGENTVFKPGYKTARGVYMILDKGKKLALRLAFEYGICFTPLSGVGHDYNYGGDLYKLNDLEKIFKQD